MRRVTMTAPITNQLIRLPEVKRKTGLSRSTVYRLCKLGQFPQSVLISIRAIAWHASEIDAWISGRPRRNSSEVRHQIPA